MGEQKKENTRDSHQFHHIYVKIKLNPAKIQIFTKRKEKCGKKTFFSVFFSVYIIKAKNKNIENLSGKIN